MTRFPSDVTNDADPTRERLIVAAARRFAEDGFDGVSLEAVARSAGVHRTTLHRHFPGGREEVVLAVLDREVAEVTAGLEAAIDAAADVREALVSALTLGIEACRANHVVAALLVDAGSRQAVFDPAAVEMRAHVARSWKRIVDRAPAGGAPPGAALDPERVVDHILRVVASLVVDPGTMASPEAVRAYVTDFVAPALVG